MKTPTRDDLIKGRMKYGGHITGEGWTGNFHSSEEWPRLQRVDRYYKKTRSVEVQFIVDGVLIEKLVRADSTGHLDKAELAAAIDVAVEMMSKPPVLTEDERHILELIPAEFERLRDLEDRLCDNEAKEGFVPGQKRMAVFAAMRGLSSKGMLEYGKEPWPDDERPAVPSHLRFNPTVRRKPQD